MAEPEYLRRLSEFVCGATLEDLPADVVDRGRWIIADCLGAIAVGMQAPEMKRLVRRMLPPRAAGKASLIGRGGTADPLLAALINGSAGTWLELDECNLAAKGHPAIQVVPAAIAVAEEREASGRDLLLAVILGYEACARIGRAARMRHALHPHGTHGAIGAAVAVARLKGYGQTDPAPSYQYQRHLGSRHQPQDGRRGCDRAQRLLRHEWTHGHPRRSAGAVGVHR